MDAQSIVEALDLKPHPEGGFYRETYRQAGPDGGRGLQTAIYFLLPEGQESKWHRVDAAEMWHFYAGAPLLLSTAPSRAIPLPGDAPWPIVERVLGPDVLRGEEPQLLVLPGYWQAARSSGAWTLVGCTVSPAFEFSGFELAPPGFLP